MALRTSGSNANRITETPDPAPAPVSSPRPQGPVPNPLAQPVMSVPATTAHPLAGSINSGDPVYPGDGAIIVRRRASSAGARSNRAPAPASTAAGTAIARSAITGLQARIFFVQVAIGLEEKLLSGSRGGALLMTEAGFETELVDAVLEYRQLYRPAMRALTGGKAHATQAQFVQALALSVFDLNRLVFSGDRCPSLTPELPVQQLPHGMDNEHFALLVSGAAQLTEFDSLHDVLVLWRDLLADLSGPEGKGLYRYLTHDLGVFHTNACRVINAFAEAVQGGDDAGLLQRIPLCLAKQWLTAPGEDELKALRRLAPVHAEQFHRKLHQQFLRICRGYGVPVPLPAELLLLEPADQAKVSSNLFDARAGSPAAIDAGASSASCAVTPSPAST